MIAVLFFKPLARAVQRGCGRVLQFLRVGVPVPLGF